MTMKLVFMEGFDRGLILAPKWDSFTLSNTWTADSGRRTGSGALDLESTGDNAIALVPVASSDILIGFAIKDYQEAVFLELYEGATKHVTFEFGASPTFYLIVKRGDGTTLHTDADSNSTNTDWHYFEFRVKCHNSTGTVDVIKDDVSIISLTGLDTNNAGASGVFSKFKLLGTHASSTWIDDLYLIDATDATDATGPTGFLGSTFRVDTVFVEGDSTLEWAASTGVTGWNLVDEVPHDSDTSYIESSTLDARALFRMAALPYTPTRIYGVQAHVVAKETVSGSMEVAPSIKIGASHYAGTDAAIGTSYSEPAHLWTANPSTLIAFTKAEVNSLLVGGKLTAI